LLLHQLDERRGRRVTAGQAGP